MTDVFADIKIIDTDTHVLEPPDLWTSRMSAKWGELIPRVRLDEKRKDEAWFIGDIRLGPVAGPAAAGFGEYPPRYPRKWSDADPATWDSRLRLRRMDEYGIYAQLLYPNVALFSSGALQKISDSKVQIEYVRAYNDYQTDFASVAPDRFIPIASLPFWDLEAAVIEMKRCKDAGHRGVLFSQEPSSFGLPPLMDRHWDRLWAEAQEMNLPVNFHIGSGENEAITGRGDPKIGTHANYASIGVSLFLANARTLAHLICGGICHRFPTLNFVSVESGIGWLPFCLDSLDWQWLNCGVHLEHPEYDLLPSEYFVRQCYGSFWFENESLPYVLDRIGPDNIMFETDFPHPTSMSPGPASVAVEPDVHIKSVFANVDPVATRKILHDNAARVYGL